MTKQFIAVINEYDVWCVSTIESSRSLTEASEPYSMYTTNFDKACYKIMKMQ